MRGEVSPPADGILEDGQTRQLGDVSLRVLHTPGHTPGSISLACDGALYTGDLILRQGASLTELAELDEAVRARSIQDVLGRWAKGREVTIHPGHGESIRVPSGQDWSELV